jgi:hypothetical protein
MEEKWNQTLINVIGFIYTCENNKNNWVLASMGHVRFYIMPVESAGALRLACA